MEPREKMEYLQEYRKAERAVDRKMEEFDHWKERALRTNSILGGTRSSGIGDPTGNAVEKMVDLQREINGEIDHLVDVRKEIGACIRKVKDDNLELLLEYRYIDGRTWEDIAERMGYSYQHVNRLHKKALDNLPM